MLRHARILVYGMALWLMVAVVLATCCTTYTTSTIVCDATVDAETGLVVEYRTEPPGDEAYCWRVYGDSLAPATGG